MMYSDVVMEKAAGIEPANDMGIRKQLEKIMKEMKAQKGAESDTDLNAEDLKKLCQQFKACVKQVLKKIFLMTILSNYGEVFQLCFHHGMAKKSDILQKNRKYSDEWGTAVNVQTMVFGNMGDDSATGVAFTRNPGNGDNNFYGEYLVNAQGEDVVAGTRTPAPG